MQDADVFDEVIPPRSFGYGPTFIDPQLRPVASKLAVAAWILALPAMVPAVGVLAALPLLIVSILLLARRDPLPHDRRVGTAGLILALISLTVTTASVVRNRVSEHGRAVPPGLRAAIADELRESGESQAAIDEVLGYIDEREAEEDAARAETAPSDGDAVLDSGDSGDSDGCGDATGMEAPEAAISDDDAPEAKGRNTRAAGVKAFDAASDETAPGEAASDADASDVESNRTLTEEAVQALWLDEDRPIRDDSAADDGSAARASDNQLEAEEYLEQPDEPDAPGAKAGSGRLAGSDGATGATRSAKAAGAAGPRESDASAEADDLKMSWAQGVLYCIVLVVSLMFHEIGHAMAAYWSGDPTARERGRFSLNPIKHLSLVGSVIVPGILILLKSDTVIGWAKPVPVSPMRLRHYRRGSLAVGVSGVSMNLLIAGAGATLLAFAYLAIDLLFPNSMVLDSPVPFVAPVIVGAKGETFWIVLICLCKTAIWANVFLAVFNLLPFPPLDGFGVVQSLVPNKLAAWMEKLSRAGLIIFAILLATNVLDKLLLPAIYIGLFFFGMVHVLTG